MQLSSVLEAILFYKSEPVTTSELASITKTKPEEVGAALRELAQALSGRGLALVEANGAVELRTAPEAATLVETMRREELEKDLSKASLETLSIILYRSPIARSDIDYIRGVNSGFILRSLLVRGLIERITDPADERRYLYRPTFDLLSHLGIKNNAELPEYAAVQNEFQAFMNRTAESHPEEQ